MNVFVRKQNKKIVVILSIIMLLMVGIPIFSLAVDNTAPEVSVDKQGRIKVGTDITYTITDDSTISAIYYAWDRHKGGEMQVLSNLNLTAPYSKTIKLPFNEQQLGVHEFSIAALDSNGNIGNWLDVAYNVVNEDVPQDYLDDDKVNFIIDTQSGAYPVSRSTINLGTPVTIGMKDDNGIYVLAHKWVKNLCSDYDYEYNLEKYYNKDTKIYTYTFNAPTEPGEWYIQFFCIDGSGLTSDLCWSKYTVKDIEPPKLTLKDGKSEIEVLINSEYVDTGAVWTDNDPKASSGEVSATNTLDTSKEGTTYLEYTYTDAGGNTTTIKRTVHVVDPVSKIEMATLPKVQYTYGETIDVTNGKVKLIHTSGKETEINLTKEMLTKYDEHQTGSQNVEVSYTDNKNIIHKTEFEMNINIPIPEIVSATYGDKLLNVKLPAGFTFDENKYNEEMVLDEIGTKEFLAIYTPENKNFAPISTEATINVLAKAINNKNITVNIVSSINEGDTLIYNTKEQVPQVTKVTLLENGKTTELDATKDYTVSILYATKDATGKYGKYEETKPVDAGTYKAKVVITGTNNYSNEVEKVIEYTITDKCIVTFYDGDKVLGTHRDILVGTSIPTNKIPNTNKEGTDTIAYKFIGWYKNSELTEEFDIENDVITTNTNIYAKYDKLEGEAYTVIFEVEGKTVKTVKSIIANDYKVELPANPSKTGHAFEGWFYTVNETEKEVTVNTQVKDNVKVIAKFTPNKYTVTLELNDGTLPQENNITEYTYGTEVILPTPTKTGYTFKGWFNNSGCTGTAITKIGATETGEKTYYAKFEKDTYTITYNKNEGTINDTNYAKTYQYGDTITLPTNVAKVGYTFAGWFVNAEFTGEAVTTITSTQLGNKEYFAKWTPNVNTAYTVEHYTQNIDLKGYSKITSETESLTGTTGATVTATAKTINGFTLNLDVAGTVKEGTVAADGSLVLKLYYNRNKYTVTLNANNGTQATTQSIEYEGTATKPANPEKQADDQYTYTFANWYTTENFEQGTEYNFNTPITQDVTLYAKYNKTAKEYNVTLNLDNGILEQGSNITKYTFGTEITLPTPTKTGYTFAGWFANDEFTGDAVTKIAATETGNKEYFAKWIPNTNTAYTVKHYKQKADLTGYDKANAEVEKLTGTTGATVTATTKTYEGYTLKQNNVLTGTIAADGSLVIEVYYDLVIYTVTFNTEGTQPVEKTTNVTKGYKVELPANPSKTGHTFLGWFTTDNKQITVDTVIKENITATAKFTPNRYAVTLNLNNGILAEGSNVTEYTYGTETTLPEPTKEGYTFAGWFNNDKFTGTAVTKITSTDIENKEFFAKWIPNTDTVYKVEHYKQKVDKTGYDLADTEEKSGTTGASVSAIQKTYTGFTLNSKAEGTVATGTITSDGKLVLKLYYDRKNYTVTFNANNGTTAATQSVAYEGTVTKPADPAKAPDAQYSYTFASWYTTSNLAEGTEYNFTTPVTQDVTLYAKYDTTINQYTITYNKDGGAINDANYAETYQYGDTITLPTNVTKTGYTFKGWFNNSAFTGTAVTGITATESGNKEYFAKFEKDTYTITYNKNEGTINDTSYAKTYQYGDTVTLPTNVTKTGYTFAGWFVDATFTGTAVTEIAATENGNKEYFAKWTANTNTAYTVEHYTQNVDLQGYSKVTSETESLTGTTGATVIANGKTINGFTLNLDVAETVKEGTVAADGSLVLKLYYDRNKYKVTLDANGGTIADNVTEVEYVYGKETALPTPTKEGYTFAGWFYTVNEAETEFTATTQIVEATTVTAKWTANTNTAYTVEHYTQNVDLQGYSKVTSETESLTGTTGATVIANGKTINGFTLNLDVAETVKEGTVAADGSLVLKLYYDRNKYKVTLDANGGTIADNVTEVEYVYGKETALPTPTKEGYTFAGWFYTVNEAETEFTATTQIVEATTVTAKWTANANTVYTVKHYKQTADLAGYDTVNAEVENLAGTTGATVTATAKTYEGYAPKQDNVLTGTVAADGSLVIEVYYDLVIYKVTFNTEGTQPVEKTTNVTKGYKVELPANPTKTGHTFTGWFTSDNKQITAETVIKENITATAHFTINQYTVTFNANNGTKATTQSINYNGTVTKPTDPEKTADAQYTYSFVGWYTTENFAEGTQYDFNTLVTQDVTLYARYSTTANKYTITYNLYKGTISDTNYAEEYQYGNTVTLPTNVTKEGYIFVGWFNDSKFTGTAVTEITATETGNKTFYAKWVALPKDLKATYGDKLFSIQLLEDFEFDKTEYNENTTVGNAGTNEFSVVYKPLNKTGIKVEVKVSAKILNAENTTIETSIQSGERLTYNTSEQPIEVTNVTFKEGTEAAEGIKLNGPDQTDKPADYEVSIQYATKDTTKEDGTLTYGAYSDAKPVNAGSYKARIIITGTGNYAKSVTKVVYYTITGKILNSTNTTIETSITTGQKLTYNTLEQPVEVTNVIYKETEASEEIKLNGPDQTDKPADYKVSIQYSVKNVKTEDGKLTYGEYSDAKPVNAGTYKVRIVITGTGNYARSVAKTMTYTITGKVLNAENTTIDTSIQTGEKLIYNTLEQPIEVTKVTFKEGTEATEGTKLNGPDQTDKPVDYEVSIQYAAKDTKKEDGTLTYGAYSDAKPVNAGSYKARIIVTGTGNYAKSVTKVVYYTITPRNLNTENTTIDTNIQSGSKLIYEENKKQEVEVTKVTFTDGEKATEMYKPADYEVSIQYAVKDTVKEDGTLTYGSYSDNKPENAGNYKARIVIKGTGNYTKSVSKVVYYTIVGRYSVIFKVEDETLTTLIAEEKNKFKVNVPEAPEKIGHTFIGWFTEDDEEFTSSTVVAANTTLKAKYTPNEYSVKLNVNGGALAEENNITKYTYGTEVALPEPTRIGYTFAGWFNGTETEAITKITTTDIGNKEFSAEWTPNEDTAYTVEYYKQNLDGTYDVAETIPATGTTDTTATASRKTFNGFTLNLNATGTIAEGNIAPDGSLVLKLYYDRNKYTITLNANGGTIADNITEVEYIYGKETILPTPTREGYTFEGWFYTVNEEETEFTTTTEIAEATTVTANWTPNADTAYTVEYYKQNLDGTYDVAETIPATGTTDTTATASRKTFNGFTLNLNAAGTIAEGNIAPDGSLVLKLYYDRNKYTITLNANGGTIADNVTEVEYVYGKNTILPTPTREGYTFAGWFYTVNEAETEFTATTQITEATTVTAKWEIKTYTVTFDAGEGTVEQETATANYGATLSSLPTPTREGYTFEGWFANDTTEFTTQTPITNNITVTAKWEIKTYTVTFDAGEGTVEQETATANYGATLSSLPTPTREGYTFEGWFANDTTEFTTQTPITNNITITAKWEIKTYTVTFKAEGTEAITKTTDVTKGYKVELPEAPTKPGNTFAGWFYTLNGVKTEFTAETVVTGNITVNAEFTENIVITKIEVENPPTTVKYGSDLKFSLTVTMNKGTTTTTTYVDSTKCTITGYDSKKVLEKQTVTVTYEGKTTTFDVIVEDGIAGIRIINDKTIYNFGEKIDKSKITVMTVMASGKDVEDVTSDSNIIAPERATTPGNMDITVKYEGYTETTTINVRKATIYFKSEGKGEKDILTSGIYETYMTLLWDGEVKGILDSEEVDSGVTVYQGEHTIAVGGTTITFSIVTPAKETIEDYCTFTTLEDGTCKIDFKQDKISNISEIYLSTSDDEIAATTDAEIQEFIKEHSHITVPGTYTLEILTKKNTSVIKNNIVVENLSQE